jgi:hypothetical protein
MTNDFPSILNYSESKVSRKRIIQNRNMDGPHLIRVSDYIRYEEGSDEPYATIIVNRLPILRTTKKGVWVRGEDYRERFVLTGANKYNKRYAYEKLEDALHSYKCRKGWQKVHGERTIKHAGIGMELAEMLKAEMEKETA